MLAVLVLLGVVAFGMRGEPAKTPTQRVESTVAVAPKAPESHPTFGSSVPPKAKPKPQPTRKAERAPVKPKAKTAPKRRGGPPTHGRPCPWEGLPFLDRMCRRRR
ncbi:hypothetical protein ACRB68_21710 [Actinomadura sp. RB68]|uniref:Uncharacterized protein n=1 Tax=Actinomadura macrotermitis TaxID=2585200 RepID=A0A7K0BSI7_9ACTN|nr:hypothetical protein [Actinomadura macrotermitis]